jgi:tRNA nucleotidyltransferase (CCA-adding enzyme)
VCREHLNVHLIGELRASTLFDLIARCDGFRRPERIAQLAITCEADKRGRAGLSELEYPAGQLLRTAHAAALAVRAADVPGDLQGPELGDALRKTRIAAIAVIIGNEP